MPLFAYTRGLFLCLVVTETKEKAIALIQNKNYNTYEKETTIDPSEIREFPTEEVVEVISNDDYAPLIMED